MEKILQDAATRGIRYRHEINDRAVAPASEAVANLKLFREPMPEKGCAPEDMLAMLDEIGSPATVGTVGPRFFGFVIGGSMPATVAANWLASAWDQNSGMHAITPGTAVIEDVALGWLRDVFGLPVESGAGFVTGCTVANFTALAAARSKVLADVGWDVEADGLCGAPEVQVLVGAEAHPTLLKSLGMLGLGRNRVVRMPVDDQGRVRADQIPTIKTPSIVCLQAGNINSGAFDPIGEICDLLQGSGAWIHVDGAFGLWAAASPRYQHLVPGLHKADSWATDAHKWLNVPQDSGIAFVRDEQILRRSMAITADYLPKYSGFRNPSDYTPELSRRARGVEVWAALRYLGRDGVAKLVDNCCINAAAFAKGLRDAGFTVLNDVVLNQVVVTFGDAETTLKVIDEIQRDGTCWCGSTVWRGQTAMRISVCNWSTTPADVERSLEVILRIARTHNEY